MHVGLESPQRVSLSVGDTLKINFRGGTYGSDPIFCFAKRNGLYLNLAQTGGPYDPGVREIVGNTGIARKIKKGKNASRSVVTADIEVELFDHDLVVKTPKGSEIHFVRNRSVFRERVALYIPRPEEIKEIVVRETSEVTCYKKRIEDCRRLIHKKTFFKICPDCGALT